jgi:hypothetical protein
MWCLEWDSCKLLYYFEPSKVYFGQIIHSYDHFVKEGLGLEIESQRYIYNGQWKRNKKDGQGEFIGHYQFYKG